ncbi:MAG: 4'-phosphopantetheinyl transferase family protein [Actinomycetales bacterium]
MSPSGQRMEYLIADASQFGGSTAPSAMAALLPPEERSRASGFRRSRDREAYAGAHVLFRLMAARWLGAGRPAELEVQRTCRTCGGPHGKPRIDGVELSLSRSADTVMIAAAPPGCAVGADLEQVPGRLFAGFDAYALAPAERESAAGPDVAGRIRLWVAKEAALKATGHGVALDPHTLSILMADTAAPWSAVVRCAATEDLDGMNIAWTPAPEGYVAALATAGTPGIVRLDPADLLPELRTAR